MDVPDAHAEVGARPGRRLPHLRNGALTARRGGRGDGEPRSFLQMTLCSCSVGAVPRRSSARR